MPFTDPLTADTVLIRAAIQSPNFVADTAGWIIRQDGTAEFNDIVARGDVIAQALKTGTTVPAQRRIDINSDPSFAGSPRNTIFFLQDGDDDSHKGVDAAEIQASGASIRWIEMLSGGTFDSGIGLNSHETVPLNANVDIGTSGHIFLTPGSDGDAGRAYVFDNPTSLFWPIVTEAHLKLLGPAVCNASLALTTAATDVPNCSLTFTTSYPNAVVFVFGQFDFGITAAIGANGVCVGQVNTDGVDETNCFAITDANTISRQGASFCRPDILAAAGSHTIKLRARKTINAGAASALLTQTCLSILVFDLP